MPAAHKIPEGTPVHDFLSHCDPAVEIYVTHIDAGRARERKCRFLTLLGTNVLWSVLLARRTLGGLRRYGVLFAIGKVFPLRSAPAPRADKALLGNLFLDFLIFSVLAPIIVDFLHGVATLRLRHGFPEEETVFRKLTPATIGNIVAEAPEKRDGFLKELLQGAVDPEEMKQMSFGMPWEEWAYDYKAMAAACKSSKDGTIGSRTWELSVWMKMKEGWTVIQHGKEESQIGMMEKLRDKLREMGKPFVFHQIMEVIQVKTMAKDGPPLPVSDEVNTIVANILKQNDIDFSTLMAEIAMDTPPVFDTGSKKDD